jgi:hypothetical protein
MAMPGEPNFSPQITQLRLANGVTVAFVDWTDQPIFSTIEILHGSNVQEMDFFQYTVGDAVPAFAPVAISGQRSATEIDTNMSQPGAMASTEEMLVFALRPEVFELTVADADEPDFAAPAALASPRPFPSALCYEVLNLRTTLLLEISQKIYSEAGFGLYNLGAGVMSAGDVAGALPVNTNGLPSQSAVRALVVPQHIGGQEKFRAFMRYADDGTGNGIELGIGPDDETLATAFARVRLYLDGLHKRPTA